MLEILLKYTSKKNDILKKHCADALICAVSNKNIEGIKLLINFGANINQTNTLGWSTLHEATNIENSGKYYSLMHY